MLCSSSERVWQTPQGLIQEKPGAGVHPWVLQNLLVLVQVAKSLHSCGLLFIEEKQKRSHWLYYFYYMAQINFDFLLTPLLCLFQGLSVTSLLYFNASGKLLSGMIVCALKKVQFLRLEFALKSPLLFFLFFFFSSNQHISKLKFMLPTTLCVNRNYCHKIFPASDSNLSHFLL